MKNIKMIIIKNSLLLVLVFLGLLSVNSLQNSKLTINSQDLAPVAYQCGNSVNGSGTAIQTSIDFGCQGDKCDNSNNSGKYCAKPHNAIIDLVFAVIRFLSDGVGIVVIASIIVGGIQYIASSGDPNNTNKAIGRIRSSIIALVVYIFAYAILNYLIPGVFFNQ